VRWKTKQSFDGNFYYEYSYQKLSKSGNWFSGYSQKCWDVFLRHSVVTNTKANSTFNPSRVSKSSTSLACLAEVKAGHVHLCWLADNTLYPMWQVVFHSHMMCFLWRAICYIQPLFFNFLHILLQDLSIYCKLLVVLCRIQHYSLRWWYRGQCKHVFG